MRWRNARVADTGTHHVLEDGALYEARFDAVLAFHEPGLAPVRRGKSAWHILEDGAPAYEPRFLRTFGFYEGRATVMGDSGWLHVLPNGTDLSAARHAWAGNYQGGRCTVRASDGTYHHVDEWGEPAYRERWRYAGDYRGGIAVVQRDDGMSSHSDRDGLLVHGCWFLDLDVFHKGFARAKDARGWTHIDRGGRPAYGQRFVMVEPFYNGQARVEGAGGELLVIDEQGRALHELRRPHTSPLQRLSERIVGFWQTQTVRAAVQLGVLDALPDSAAGCAAAIGLVPEPTNRLLRALWEMGIVERRVDTWHPTDIGGLLRRDTPGSAADAALIWGGEHYAAWTATADVLRYGHSAFEAVFGQPFFEHLGRRADELAAYHGAMAAYAVRDYHGISGFLPLEGVCHVVDAGGSTGVLLQSLLSDRPNLTGTLLERQEVVDIVSVPEHLATRLEVVAGDILAPWSFGGDLIIFARVLHDWNDEDAVRILSNARGALSAGGRIILIEMVLADADPRGSLLDINMLVMCGSRERMHDDWVDLAHSAGLRVVRVTPLPTYGSVLVLEAGDAVAR
jgi:O-methyltransferase domain